MEMNEEKKQKIIEIMKSNNVVAGFLFGSYARGGVGPMSDLDVAVIFPLEMDIKFQEDKIEEIRSKILNELTVKSVDVINMTKVESPLLRYNILIEEGQLLFSENQSLVSYFIMKALRDFEDTKKLRQRRDYVLNKFFVSVN